MSKTSRSPEFKVGFFVLIGLAAIAVMAVQFGRMGQALKEYYTLTVNLPDAGGIIKGSDVLLAGARIGFVSEKPKIGTNINSVAVELKVNADILLPVDTKFTVGSSGLLGDRFIQVSLTPDFDPETFDPEDPAQVRHDGDVIEGAKSSGGISELTEKGGVVMDDLRKSLAQVQEAVATFQSGVLSEKNLQNLEKTFANLKETSDNFVGASAKLDHIAEDAQEVVGGAKTTIAKANKTMTTANAAAEDIRLAIGDARDAIGNAEEMLDSAKAAVNKATKGQGLVAALLTNRELAENLSALVSNLRRHGVLFYRDSEAKRPPAVDAPTRRAIPTANTQRNR
jgi:phospholipid/cholesterol/gamma-HCH transport system substrate-binding protein